jgi:subtilisin family serine protease
MVNRSLGIGIAALLALATAKLAGAQVALPQVQVPNLPIQTPIDVNRTLNGALDAANPDQLRELRALKVRELLRTHRTELEADPRGAPMVRSEVLSLSPTSAALEKARAAGFEVLRTRTLDSLGVNVVVLHAPERMSTRQALRRLQALDPEGVYDFNHLYLESGETAAPSPDAPVGAAQNVPAHSGQTTRIGLIDGGVDRSHPVFQGVQIQEHGCQAPIASAHGTAVASLVAGSSAGFHGAAPGASLYVADVYCGLATGGALDAVADAFAWLLREQILVINVSLVGPPNKMLEQIVRIVTARGSVVVAAVGNDGPSAPPLYPAAYPGVIAVTGVDQKKRVLVEACRGPHVAFAAPGADMAAAALQQTYATVRGTSFAAPIVAGLIATHLQKQDKEGVSAALDLLSAQAIDLGPRGPDKIYGKGLLGDELRNGISLAQAAAPIK